jgi:hypothetical protein
MTEITKMTDDALKEAREAAFGLMASRDPDESIGRNGHPYMLRWHQLRNDEGLVANIYVHKFLRDDTEALHDHPWRNQSFVISGSYVEEYIDENGEPVRRTLVAGDTVHRDATAIHRIVSIEPDTVTIFVTGKKEREWGFFDKDCPGANDNGWVHHTIYNQHKDQAA